jgi:hypothetical protein
MGFPLVISSHSYGNVIRRRVSYSRAFHGIPAKLSGILFKLELILADIVTKSWPFDFEMPQCMYGFSRTTPLVDVYANILCHKV